MPRAEQLPQSIRALTRRNGVDLSGPAWKARRAVDKKTRSSDIAQNGPGSIVAVLSQDIAWRHQRRP